MTLHCLSLIDYFNSIKVQLKAQLKAYGLDNEANFNSIKVQLKHGRWSLQSAVHSFQFHKGTIKAFDFEAREHGLIVFQFHKGTIKAGESV